MTVEASHHEAADGLSYPATAAPESAGNVGFLGLDRYAWTVFFAAWLGWGFDVFDGLLFNFVAPICVPDLLHLPAKTAGGQVATTTGAITALLLVGWASGGIVFGWAADRIGRSRTLLLTMLTYAVATAACALAPNIWVLAALRFVASLGIGGEWAAGASLVAEVIPERRRVAAGALLYTAAPLGVMLAGLVSELFLRHLSLATSNPGLAWRLVFLTGLVPALLALWIRRQVHEPDVWRAQRERGHQPARLGELFAPQLRRATLGGLAMSVVTLVTWWATNAFLPFIVRSLGGAGHQVSLTLASTLFNVGGVVGTLATVPLAALGRRWMFALFLAASSAAIWVTFGMKWEPQTRVFLLALDGLTVFGVLGAFSFYLPELFPTRLRGTGLGFCFNVSRYLAAPGPYCVGLALAASTSPIDAIRWIAVVPLCGLLFVPFIAETHARGIPR